MNSSARTRSLQQLRRLVEQPEVGLDLPRRGRPLHLDRDLLPVGQHGAMHLPDRRGRDRHLVELDERLLDREPELGLDTSRTCSNGNGVTSSWRPRSSTTMSGGTTSGRVESSWPNLTKVGPSSSSISRSRRPRSETVASPARVVALPAAGRRGGSGAGSSRSRGGPRPGRSRTGARGCAACCRVAMRAIVGAARSAR